MALSVDGLNSIDARQTTAEARRFEFTTEKSYGQALGKTANLGVISAVFFKERPRTFIADGAPEHAGRATPRPAAPEANRAEDEYAATELSGADFEAAMLRHFAS